MGFRTGAYAKVWSVEPKLDTVTQLRISVARKNRDSGEYEQDFSGFVAVIGTAAAKKASLLKEGDTIVLGDTDVTTTYDKEKKKGYTDYKLFSFEKPDDGGKEQKAPAKKSNVKEVDSGEVEAPEDDHDLPF